MNKLLIAGLCALYIISPIDLVPDIPIVGWFDDLAVAIWGAFRMVQTPKLQ